LEMNESLLEMKGTPRKLLLSEFTIWPVKLR
jgi:hypothetical protein